MCAGDFGGGGLGLFGADLFHFLVGEAVGFAHLSGATAHGGVDGGAESPFPHRGKSLGEIFDDACSRSGMRLSALAAVEEFVPPRERHWRVWSAGAWAMQ